MISTRLIALLTLAATLPLSESTVLDVWVPHITNPNEGTVWLGGTYQTITWDASNPPAAITNPTGKIYLVTDNTIQFQYELASGFELADGQVEVYLFDVLSGDYQIVLMGDSGNFSPTFRIVYQ